jgi:hypothetical protein
VGRISILADAHWACASQHLIICLFKYNNEGSVDPRERQQKEANAREDNILMSNCRRISIWCHSILITFIVISLAKQNNFMNNYFAITPLPLALSLFAPFQHLIYRVGFYCPARLIKQRQF